MKEGNFIEVCKEDIETIKCMLKKQDLTKEINLKYPSIDLDICISKLRTFHVFDKTRKFGKDESLSVLSYKGKPVQLHMYIGTWSANARIKGAHISIYTDSNKIGGERFVQIELSDCIEDDKYIYILKNLSNNAGKGAISRLNKYSYSTSEKEKREQDLKERREELVRRTQSEVINYDNKEWLCVYKFNKEKLYDTNYRQELFNEFIERILVFTFGVESIILEVKENGEFKRTEENEEDLATDIILSRIKKLNKKPRQQEIKQKAYIRDRYIVEYAKRRADGVCQLCEEEAPFRDRNRKPYLEVHHIKPLSEGGEDSIENTVALCPNCHRKMHSLGDIEDIKHLINVNSFDYISLREIAIDCGVEAYNIRIYSNGKIEDFTNNNKNKHKKKKLDWNIIEKLFQEVKDFNFRNFELKDCEFFMTCQPSFEMQVKYADGYSKEIYYDYGSNYENTSGDNKIDILDLKSNLEEILKLKNLSDIFR